MKKTILSIFLAFLTLAVCAEDNPSLFKKALQMERLRKDGLWLEAMDTATLILTYDRDYRTAVDFVHRYWDKTMTLTNDRLASLSDDSSLAQAAERCEIYRLLDEVHENLRQVKMPLYGPNQKWVWQPEVGYYSGHYDSERQKTFRLLLSLADQSLRSYDAEGAMAYYQLALSKYLITDGERSSNLSLMLSQCNSMIVKLRKSDKIYDAIFAYDLCSLSLQLDEDQPQILSLQTEIQQYVASLYLNAANTALLAGDSVQAKELRLSYEEWSGVQTDSDTNTDTKANE